MTSGQTTDEAPALTALAGGVSASRLSAASRAGARAGVKWLVLLVVWGLCAGYTANNLKRGWVAPDEGFFGQSAERVLAGEMPHRDFDELYTGGVTYLNAVAFRVLGISLASLRVVLFLFFLVWVPATYFIALRFAAPVGAGSVTLLAAAWSGVPDCPAAYPATYNMIFAALGTAALFRYVETRAQRWLFVAGFCGGLSFLAKISAVYYMAGALLFLLFCEQGGARGTPPETRGGTRAYPVVMAAALLSFVGLLCGLIRNRFSSAEVFHFVLPGSALAALVLWREGRGAGHADRKRFAALLRMLAPFAMGVAIPIALFLIPYILSGSVGFFVRGVFILPLKRLAFTSWPPPGLHWAGPALALSLVLAITMYRCAPVRWYFGAGLAACLAAELVRAVREPSVYQMIWRSLALLTPFVVLAGAVLLGSQRLTSGVPMIRQEQAFLLLSETAMFGLIQFPFAAPVYFYAVGSWLGLTLLALLPLRGHAQRWVLGPLLMFYLLFAEVIIAPGFIYAMGYSYAPDQETHRLTLPRAGGLRVTADEAEEYERLIPLVRQNAGGDYIYAAPDCPEVYFLAGLGNPTRTTFDFFDDASGRTERILSAIETHGVNTVVIRSDPRIRRQFSQPLAPELKGALQQRFPNSATVGRFEVHWRP